jgi:hypothetical protein
MFVRLSADQMGFTRITESKPHRISPGYKRRKRVQKPSPNSCSRMPRLPELLFLILRTNINADNLAENAMRRVALGRRNWIHIGSEEAGPRVAAIVSIVETCRRLKIPIREYLCSILPGLANFSINRIAQLTPAAWLPRN